MKRDGPEIDDLPSRTRNALVSAGLTSHDDVYWALHDRRVRGICNIGAVGEASIRAWLGDYRPEKAKAVATTPPPRTVEEAPQEVVQMVNRIYQAKCRSKDMERRALALRLQRKTYAEIGEALGVSGARVGQIVRKAMLEGIER